MTFDHTYKPNRDNLTPATAMLMDRAFYARRVIGWNVQFMNEGKRDEWSFNSAERAQAFANSLSARGLEFAFSV
jgi:hypothetical protein